MPPRRDGVCRHCCAVGWIVGRGLCRSCYANAAVRSRYRRFRAKRRRVRGSTYGHCVVCGQWRYIAARERCQSCYREYGTSWPVQQSADADREARIQEYARRAALGLPLFPETESFDAR